MSQDVKNAAAPPKLVAVYFPTISVASGLRGGPSMISEWNAAKHGEIRCEERQNGDVWLYHPNGFRTEISALVISHRVRAVEAVKK